MKYWQRVSSDPAASHAQAPAAALKPRRSSVEPSDHDVRVSEYLLVEEGVYTHFILALILVDYCHEGWYPGSPEKLDEVLEPHAR